MTNDTGAVKSEASPHVSFIRKNAKNECSILENTKQMKFATVNCTLQQISRGRDWDTELKYGI